MCWPVGPGAWGFAPCISCGWRRPSPPWSCWSSWVVFLGPAGRPGAGTYLAGKGTVGVPRVHPEGAVAPPAEHLDALLPGDALRFVVAPPGDGWVMVVSVGARGELGRRVREMGLVPGCEVEVVGRAPLKDPVALRLKDFTLSLRNNEADHIMVEPL